MDTRLLTTFLKVNDLGSFTKASAELGYAQSTVTAQIRQLEEELGYPLFDRIGRQVFLTQSGSNFISLAEEILRLSRQAQFLEQAPEELHATLRIGVLESLLTAVLTDVLPRYKAVYPCVDVRIKTGTASDLLHWLKENTLDLVYYSHDLHVDPDYTRCYCREEQLCFVSAPSSPLASQKHIPLETFLKQPLIMPEHTGLCFTRLRKLAAQQGLALRCTVEVNNMKAISELLSRGMGCSFLPRYAVLPELLAGTMTELSVDVQPQIYYSQIVYHKSKWIAPYQTTFVELIRSKRPETA